MGKTAPESRNHTANTKILRKTLRKLMSETKYNSEDFAEFKAYNEFCESV